MAITVNPFSILGTQHQAGLNYVIQNLSGSSSSSGAAGGAAAPTVTIDQLVQSTVDYIRSIYGSSLNSISDLELSIMISDAINGYINAKAGGCLNYSSRQEFFIFQLLEGIHSSIPTYGIKQYIEDIEENIVQSGMSTTQQNQLLMATAIGKADFDYWLSIGNDEGLYYLWEPFFDKMGFGSSNDVAWLIAASMEATLFAEKHRSNATVLEVASTNGANSVAALAASIGVTAGVVIFQWVQKPKRPSKSLGKVPSFTAAVIPAANNNSGLPAGVSAPPAGLFENSGGNCGC